MFDCRFPFAHSADTCSCSPSQAQILLRKADMRERARSSVFSDGKTLGQAAGIALLSFSLIFLTGFAVAAIVDRGAQNWINTRVANVQP